MEKVQGVGGVFVRSRDREALCRWYGQNLGLDIDESWWGTVIRWSEQDRAGEATMIWSAFAQDTEYFGPANKGFMINFRVRDLDAMRAQLIAGGCDVDERVEESEFGRFGWVTDPEGNRVELWQAPAGQ